MREGAAKEVDGDRSLRYEDAPERRRHILRALGTDGFVAVTDLARELRVSAMTVRRDLRKLEEAGRVRVVRGGVSLPHGTLSNAGFATRVGAEASAKRRIALRARRMLRPDDTVALDAGTTTHELAATISENFTGSVVTHSLPVMQTLMKRSGVGVVALGGDLLRVSQAFVGPMSVDAAARLRVRAFFLGAAAIDDRGVYVAADAERPTKLALMDIADEVLLLVDATKFTRVAPVQLCGLERLSAVVTDSAPPQLLATALRAAGVALHVATEES